MTEKRDRERPGRDGTAQVLDRRAFCDQPTPAAALLAYFFGAPATGTVARSGRRANNSLVRRDGRRQRSTTPGRVPSAHYTCRGAGPRRPVPLPAAPRLAATEARKLAQLREAARVLSPA